MTENTSYEWQDGETQESRTISQADWDRKSRQAELVEWLGGDYADTLARLLRDTTLDIDLDVLDQLTSIRMQTMNAEHDKTAINDQNPVSDDALSEIGVVMIDPSGRPSRD